MQAHDQLRYGRGHDEAVTGRVITVAEAIDLGEVERDWHDDIAAVPWRPPAWLRHGTRVLALVLVTVLGLHASASRLTRDMGEPLWTAKISRDGFGFGPEAVHVPDGPHAVVARDPWTGEEMWRREFADRLQYTMDVGTGVAVFSTSRSLDSGAGESWTTTLVSPRTGEVFRQSQSQGSSYPLGPTFPSADHMILVGYQEPGTGACPAPEPPEESGCTSIESVRIRGAETTWSLSLAPREEVVPAFVDGRVSAFATINLDSGHVRIHDVTTAETTGMITVEGPVTSGVLTEDHLIVTTEVEEYAVLTAYDRTTLAPDWRARLPMGTLAGYSPWVYIHECEELLCASTGAGTTLLDPATGDVRMVLTDQVVLITENGLAFAVGGPERSEPDESVAVWDTGTGRLVEEFAKASLVNWSESGGRGLLTRSGSEGTTFILVDEHRRSRVLGAVPDRDLGCEARGELIVCTNYLGMLSVWRLPT